MFTCYLLSSATGNEEVLNQVDLPILDDSVCQSEFPVFLSNTEVCAGYKNQGKDWCGVKYDLTYCGDSLCLKLCFTVTQSCINNYQSTKAPCTRL